MAIGPESADPHRPGVHTGSVMHPHETALADPLLQPDTVPHADAGRSPRAGGPAAAAWAASAPDMLGSATLQAWANLRRMRGPGEQKAILLALLLTPGSARERQAWAEETRGVMTAGAGLLLVDQLPAAARLPAIEAMLVQCAELPLEQRQAMLQAARRVMCADGRVRPIDRLLLIRVRHGLNGPVAAHRGGVRDANELSGLPLALRQAIAELSAYLARLVPVADPHARVGAAGAAWHQAVVQVVWGGAPHPPTCQVPDSAALVHVLRVIQDLGWMRRPVLVRAWMDAVQASQPESDVPRLGPPLSLTGAEALRMACGLLDTPVPPDLARYFNALPQQG